MQNEEQVVVADEVKEQNKTNKTQKTNKVSPKQEQIDDNTIVEVYNNNHGRTFYTSPRTQEFYVWHAYNDMIEMPFHELKLMKNNKPIYFKKHWLRIENDQAITKLRLDRNYKKDMMSPEEIEEFFDLHIDEMEEILDKGSLENKALILGIAREKIESEEFTHARKIQLLEEKLGVDLH